MQASARITKELEAIRQGLEETANTAMDVADQSVEKTKTARREIGEEVTALSTVPGEVTDALKKSLDALDQSKEAMQSAAASAGMKLEQAAGVFSDQTTTIDKAADQASEKKGIVGDGVRQRSEDLTSAADDAQSRLSGFRKPAKTHA